jgi:enoyl-CoA hydratase
MTKDPDPTGASCLAVERRGDYTAWITLDRPEKLNALSAALLDALAETLAELVEDDGVRVLVFTGAGRAFSVGADVADFESITSSSDRRRYIERSLGVLGLVADSPKPTIAAIHGLALGGGCELAMACDVVVAGASAELGLPEARLGVVPTFALTRGRSRLGRGTLAYLSFTGRRVGAAEARDLGLVDLVAEGDPREEATALAGEIAANAPLAVQAAKQLLRDGGGAGAAAAVSVAALGSEDHARGVEAFRRREPPRFVGR